VTLATTSNTTVAQGNGLTTSFDFIFPVPNLSELFVYFTAAGASPVPLSQSQYSVTGIGTPNGGAVNYPLSGSPIPSGSSLTIQREVPYVQLTSLVDQSGYYPNVVENALDYLTMQTQQLAEQQLLTLTVPLESSLANLQLPNKASRANELVGFDSSGNAVTYPVTASIGAGNLTNESWTNGTDFTAGTSTSVLLTQNYGTIANLGTVVMQGIAQDPNSYSLTGANNQTLLFNAVIPVGVSRIYCVGGTTLSLGTVPTGSVGPAQLTPQKGTTLQRPLLPYDSQFFLDTTLGQPIWALAASSTGWINAAGAYV
jgi:hypothetical protein